MVFLIAMFALGGDSEQDAARDHCKDSVLNNLATPATTKFIDDITAMPSGLNSFELVDVAVNVPWFDDDRITNVWEVNGSFDTENRRGATVRGHYSCKAVFAGDEFITTVTSVKTR